MGRGWEHQIVTELDSALNEWHNSIPDHCEFQNIILKPLRFSDRAKNPVRWDPRQENTEFLHQSAVLYANYYHLQIFVHRPFVSSSPRPSHLSFPSLAICMNAARSCARLSKCSRERLRPILHHLTVPSPPRSQPALSYSSSMMTLDADIHSWSHSALQHLGWEVGGDERGPDEGNGGRASVYACA